MQLAGTLSLMQQMPDRLAPTALASVHATALSSVGCTVGAVCDASAFSLRRAMLASALSSGELDIGALPQLLSAQEWGIVLQPSCAENGVIMRMPEPVIRINATAPSAADFYPTVDGAPALNGTALLGPQESGTTARYLFELSLATPPAGGESFTVRVGEEALVAPLRGIVPLLTLTTSLADCRPPSIVSVTALPANESGSFAIEGWHAAVRATVGLRIIFSEAVASRAASGVLSRLSAASFDIDALNGTEVLEVRVSSAAGMDPGSTRSSLRGAAGGRRGLLDASAFVTEATVLVGVAAPTEEGDVMALIVRAAAIADQSGNVMPGVKVWNDIPGAPPDRGCPWLGGLIATGLVAAWSLLELSWRLMPEKGQVCCHRRRRKASQGVEKYRTPVPVPGPTSSGGDAANDSFQPRQMSGDSSCGGRDGGFDGGRGGRAKPNLQSAFQAARGLEGGGLHGLVRAAQFADGGGDPARPSLDPARHEAFGCNGQPAGPTQNPWGSLRRAHESAASFHAFSRASSAASGGPPMMPPPGGLPPVQPPLSGPASAQPPLGGLPPFMPPPGALPPVMPPQLSGWSMLGRGGGASFYPGQEFSPPPSPPDGGARQMGLPPALKAAMALKAAQAAARKREMAKMSPEKRRLSLAEEREREVAEAAKAQAQREKAREWRTPRLGVVVWVASLTSCGLLLAAASVWRAVVAPTVLPLVPVWAAQLFALSAQCGKGRRGRELLPALRTLGALLASIAACVVISIPDATLGYRPESRALILGPAFLLAALAVAADATISKWPHRPTRAKRCIRRDETDPEEPKIPPSLRSRQISAAFASAGASPHHSSRRSSITTTSSRNFLHGLATAQPPSPPPSPGAGGSARTTKSKSSKKGSRQRAASSTAPPATTPAAAPAPSPTAAKAASSAAASRFRQGAKAPLEAAAAPAAAKPASVATTTPVPAKAASAAASSRLRKGRKGGPEPKAVPAGAKVAPTAASIKAQPRLQKALTSAIIAPAGAGEAPGATSQAAIFKRYDRNDSGKIDVRELREALRALGFDPTNRDAERVLQRFDRNHDGVLDFEEWAAIVAEFRRLQESKKARAAAKPPSKASVRQEVAKSRSKGRERAQEERDVLKAALARSRAKQRAERARERLAHREALRTWRRELRCRLGAQAWASLALLLAALGTAALVPPWRFGGRLFASASPEPDVVDSLDYHVCYTPSMRALYALLALLLPLLLRLLRLACRTAAREVNLGVALALNVEDATALEDSTDPFAKLLEDDLVDGLVTKLSFGLAGGSSKSKGAAAWQRACAGALKERPKANPEVQAEEVLRACIAEAVRSPRCLPAPVIVISPEMLLRPAFVSGAREVQSRRGDKPRGSDQRSSCTHCMGGTGRGDDGAGLRRGA